MKAPQNQYLVNQSFNSKKIEFVWQFPNKTDNNLKDQFVCQIELNPVVYMEAGVINSAGNYVEEPNKAKFGYGHIGPEAFLIYPANTGWSKKEAPEVYKNFTNGQDLVSLVNDVVEYLKTVSELNDLKSI